MAVEVCMGCLMFFFRDDKVLEEESSSSSSNSNDCEMITRKYSVLANNSGEEMLYSLLNAPEEQTEKKKSKTRLIPYFLFLQSFITGIGIGIIDIYFPLYFKDVVSLSPIRVQAIYVAEPLVTAASFGPARTISRRIGRVQTMILAKSIGVLLLFFLALMKTPLSNSGIFVILSYLMYVIMISATDPLEESLFMDYSPRRQRARWMSLDSIVEFGSSASAVLGGVLSDEYNNQVAIFVSTVVQSVGKVVIFVVFRLFPIVP
mmetsp:Transcript_12681/g.19043  ORF Transcript_12681/g.19043 Transcript_12681/m.19043 type:complete len:261 (-) Transcript_12681:179-961(-)